MHLKNPPWLEKILNFTRLKWLKMHLNCPPWLEKILKFTHLKCLEMHLNCPPRLEKILKFTYLEYLEMHLNCPPWLEKILKFTDLKCLNQQFMCMQKNKIRQEGSKIQYFPVLGMKRHCFSSIFQYQLFFPVLSSISSTFQYWWPPC